MLKYLLSFGLQWLINLSKKINLYKFGLDGYFTHD